MHESSLRSQDFCRVSLGYKRDIETVRVYTVPRTRGTAAPESMVQPITILEWRLPMCLQL
jgi:hypothetical protein